MQSEYCISVKILLFVNCFMAGNERYSWNWVCYQSIFLELGLLTKDIHVIGFVYMCFVVTCWERADLLALVCGV